MDADRAQALAECLHHGQREAGGAPLIDHIGRVAAAVPGDARVVAWLHEVLEHTSISEEALLAEGLTTDELRALRLLTRDKSSRSNTRYLAHVDQIARARGPGAGAAQGVKRADMADRALNPPIRTDGWSPPYELGLEVLRRAASRRSRPPSSLAAPTRTHAIPTADPAHNAPVARAAGEADTATRGQAPAAGRGRP